ncbi:MAG: hypothetical protein NVSMB27_12900 [Ktedonobacteraceae bacterium]
MSRLTQAAVQTRQMGTEASTIKGGMLRRAAVSSALTPVHNGTLQRCSGGVECAACREKREGMQRAAVNSAPVNAIPPIVHDVLTSSGQPLDAGTRAFMEPRFGHDFSQVRVHTDAKAAESAQAVNALAYTVGRDVVFGMGQYAPGTGEGRRLMAHELTHVVQQQGTVGNSWVQHKLEISEPGDTGELEAEHNACLVEIDRPPTFAARSPVLARAGDRTTVEVTPPDRPNVCQVEQHEKIFPTIMQAQDWLDQTIPLLATYANAPNNEDKDNKRTRDALNHHFRTTDVNVAKYIERRLEEIKTNITKRTDLNVECHDAKDQTCGVAGAYVINSNNLLVFCPKFFTGSNLWRAEAIIHEMAHALVGGDFITDRGYAHDRIYTLLSTDEALTNAESYGLFVQELGAAREPDISSPKDAHKEDCPENWKGPITVAIARAQRWNRDAQNWTRDRRPVTLDEWVLPRSVYLGETSSTAIDAAQKAYDTVETELKESIDFECEPKGGGRCAEGAHVYWYGFLSDFHICPAWMELNEDDRIIYMLAGLYGYQASVSENTRRLNYARLARALSLMSAPQPRRDIGKESNVPVFE